MLPFTSAYLFHYATSWEKMHSLLLNSFLETGDYCLTKRPDISTLKNTTNSSKPTCSDIKEQVINKTFVKCRMVCLILGRPSSKVMKEELLPNFEYWHHRSGINIDIISIGFNADKVFSERDFAESLKDIECRSTWRYSGQTDILVLNCLYNKDNNSVTLDFGTAISITLEDAIKEKAIENSSSFFEKIISYAATCDGVDPTWGLSDFLAQNTIKSVFICLMLQLLPEFIRQDISRLTHFIIKDVRLIQ